MCSVTASKTDFGNSTVGSTRLPKNFVTGVMDTPTMQKMAFSSTAPIMALYQVGPSTKHGGSKLRRMGRGCGPLKNYREGAP